ncbi:hypothetical protein PANO111632_05620 [Paracoccus nototheniae]|uniref:Uncharacterized protein n=1 Tax=Paracoccus nototheniae TaxID=2489002 RepID=A0ABW4E0V1_9RHOB|nr:hypothetical protein [Paracoccus nototheniae]
MNMDQTKDESKDRAQLSEADQEVEQFCDRVEAAMNSQLELCIAGMFILLNSDKLRHLESAPEVLALRGIIGAIKERANAILIEVETDSYDAAIRDAFGGAA